MKWADISAEDQDIIAGQIRRSPRNLIGVARRCRHQCPQVVMNHPLPREEADAYFFPTLYWLTCPAAVQRIGRLEDQGYIARIQAALAEHPQLLRALQDAHAEYIYTRNKLLPPELRLEVRVSDKALAEGLEHLGIGGVADLTTIKCLHMHYAHYLATNRNPIGQLVETLLKLEEAGECRQCRQRRGNAGVAK